MPYSVQVGWDDAPHLSEAAKEELRKSYPPHEVDARTKGIPMLGAGRIYPYDEAAVVCDPFKVPSHWPKAYGLDVGWNVTAALWGAWDGDADVIYLYAEYYAGQQATAVHAEAIKRRGAHLWGAVDPASEHMVANMKDGERVLEEYRECGLHLVMADNTVYAGITACQNRYQTGRLKIFRTCVHTISEFRIYRTEKTQNGRSIQIVKQNDHAMDAKRYLIMTGMQYAQLEPSDDAHDDPWARNRGRSKETGY